MKKILLILGILFLLLLIGIPLAARFLAPRVIAVPPPSGQPIGEYELPRAETSVMAMEIRVPVQALEVAANREAPQNLQGQEQKNIHKRITNGAYAWNVARGNIRMQNTGQSLAFAVPIQGVAQARGDLNVKILRIPLQGSAEIAGTVAGTINPQIAPNWELIPNLVPVLNLTKADLHLGTIGTIGIKDFISESINPIIQTEAQKIGPSVIKELNLKGEVDKLWSEAHVTDQISDEPPIWIQVRPNAVMGTPLNYSNPAELSATIAIQSQTTLYNSLPAELPPVALPHLSVQAQAPGTNLRIPFVVSIARLNEELAKKKFVIKTSIGTDIKVGGLKVLVGQNGFLNFSVSLSAGAGRYNRAVSGEIWLKGKPIIDYAAQTLAFSEVDFTLETKDSLTKGAAWLLEELLVKGIEREMRVNLNDYQAEINEEVNKNLQSDDIPEGVEVSLQDLQVRLADIYTYTKPTPTSPVDPGVVIVIQAIGKASTVLTELKPQ